MIINLQNNKSFNKNLPHINIEDFNLQYIFEKNTETKNLKNEKVPLAIIPAAIKIQEKQERASENKYDFNIANTIDSVALNQLLHQEVTSLQSITKANNVEKKANVLNQNNTLLENNKSQSLKEELNEVINILKQSLTQMGRDNPEILNLNTFDFEEFRDTNILAYKMMGNVKKNSITAFLALKHQFDAKLNSLILLAESKNHKTDSFKKAKLITIKLVTIKIKYALEDLLNSSKIHRGDEPSNEKYNGRA